MASCMICNHPNRAVIEAAILSGEASEEAIASMASCHQSTINRHKRQHMAISTQAVTEEIESLEPITELPEDILGYVALKVVNAIERLELKAKKGSYKADESIATLANSILNIDKRIQERDEANRKSGDLKLVVISPESHPDLLEQYKTEASQPDSRTFLYSVECNDPE